MKVKKILYYFLLFLMAFSIIASIAIVIKMPTMRKEKRLTGEVKYPIEINKDKDITQYFLVQTDTIRQVKIYFHEVSNTEGNIKLTFYDDKDKVISTKKVKIKNLIISGVNIIDVENLNNMNGKQIHMKIEVENTDSTVTLYSSDEYYPNQYINFEGEKVNQSLSMYYEGGVKNKALIVHLALIFCVSSILALFLRDEVIQEGNDKNGKTKKK